MGLRLSGLASYFLFQRSMNMTNKSIFKASEQLSTNKRINRPSDDPEGLMVVMGLKETINKMDQYNRNLDTANRLLSFSETALQQVADALGEVRDIALQASSPSLSADNRVTLGTRVNQLSQLILGLANTQIDSQYIFSGVKTDARPFALAAGFPAANPAATFSGSTIIKSVEIGKNVTLDVQSRGDLVFLGDGTANNVNIFQTLADFEVALRTGNFSDTSPTGVPQEIDNLNTAHRQIVNEISVIGSRENRVESVISQYQKQRDALDDFILGLEDADLAAVAMEFKRTQATLQATLIAGQKILNVPSLLDFMGR